MPKAAYSRRKFDATRVDRLTTRLRRMPAARAILVVKALIDRDDKLGLQVANRVLREHAHFEQLLRQGLATANASTIRDWLTCTVDRIGIRRALDIIRERLADDPRAVERALYWLPGVIGDEAKARELLEPLRADLHAPR